MTEARAYEELRRAIDDGSESMTHDDAVQWVKDAHQRLSIPMPILAADITEPGFYWARQGTFDWCMYEVFDNDGYGLRLRETDGESYDLLKDRWPKMLEFIGPIQPPGK